MAKKTRKQKQRAATRRVGVRSPLAPGQAIDVAGTDSAEPDVEGDASNGTATAVTTPLVSSATIATATSVAAGGPPRRRIERLSDAPAARAGRSTRGPSNAAALFQPLEAEDAAIPFDRVPYVPADLRRVAVMAVVMVVLILVAALVVTHVVQ